MLTYTWNGLRYEVDETKGISLALPLVPNGENPTCYYAEAVQAEVIRAENFVGSVTEGGSVNYQRLHLTPHGNGTHTECVGHISAEPITMMDCMPPPFLLAQVISVTPNPQAEDLVITWESIESSLAESLFPALIIRTIPNTEAKKNTDYSGTNPPYLSPEVGQKLAEKGITHLLVDLPSVDKEVDGGILSVHKGFWQFPEKTRKNATITELIFVPDTVSDGNYLLNLQLPRLAMDAVPSQPLIFPLAQ